MVVASHKDVVTIKTSPVDSLTAARCQADRPTGTVVAVKVRVLWLDISVHCMLPSK